MTKEEDQILLDLDRNILRFDHKKKYSDDFYETYIGRFKINKKSSIFYRFIKRLFDICISLSLIILLLIPFILMGIAIKMDSKGPVFFKNRRVGKNGVYFYCLKFRSMIVSAPPETATSIFSQSNNYITRVGRFLRKTSIDELPQIFNVLLGQMSIIGYRPLILTEENCNSMRMRLGVFTMRPGISGLAQVFGRDDVYYKNKAIIDAYYVKNASLVMDLKIIIMTISVVLSKKGNKDR